MAEEKSRYGFATTPESRSFCGRIEQALMRFCGKTQDEAVSLIAAYWQHRDRIDDDPLLFSEPPYFYAMCMAHHPTLGDGQVNWHEDPELWPPPEGWEFK